jgi:ATP-binding protein involved in chromosome partitioning
MQLTEATVRGRLAGVEDPFLGGSILDLGLVADVDVDPTTIHVTVALNAPYAPDERRIGDRIRDALSSLDRTVRVYADPPTGAVQPPLSHVKNVVAVTSGPQRAGQTAVAVNLAAELASRGARVGVLDADVDGPAVRSALDVTDAVDVDDEGTLVPVERDGLKVASVTDVLGEDPPHVERTGLGERLLAGLVHDVEWQPLDYLFVVAPPVCDETDGRFLDAAPVTGAVVVTSAETSPAGDGSQCVDALVDRGVPVLGIAENTPSLDCPGCRPGWGRRAPDRVDPTGVLCLGPVSVDPEDGVVVENGDEAAASVSALADAVTNEVGVLHRLTACAVASENTATASGCPSSYEWRIQFSDSDDDPTSGRSDGDPTGEYIKRCKLVHS